MFFFFSNYKLYQQNSKNSSIFNNWPSLNACIWEAEHGIRNLEYTNLATQEIHRNSHSATRFVFRENPQADLG